MGSKGGDASKAVDAATAKATGSLVTLRARALEVHVRLAELVDVMAQVRDGVGMARDADYTTLLAKYDALSNLVRQLCDELRSAALDSYVVHPTAGAGALPTGEVPELLRTMREPELERDGEMLAASYPHNDETTSQLAARVIEHNDLIERLVEFVTEKAEEHAPEPMTEPTRAHAPPAANAILAALTSGAGL